MEQLRPKHARPDRNLVDGRQQDRRSAHRDLKGGITEKRTNRKVEQTPVSRQSEAGQVFACFPDEHADHWCGSEKLNQKPCSDCTCDDQDRLDVRADHGLLPRLLFRRTPWHVQNRVMFAAGGFGYFATLSLYFCTALNNGTATHWYISPMLCSSRGSASMLKTLG